VGGLKAGNDGKTNKKWEQGEFGGSLLELSPEIDGTAAKPGGLEPAQPDPLHTPTTRNKRVGLIPPRQRRGLPGGVRPGPKYFSLR